jgi:copper chaperone CopZ
MSRNWLAILLIAGVVTGCATPESRQPMPESSGIDLTSSREVVLTVYGMSCPLCSNNLDGQLRQIEGVEDAVIDLKTGAVSVRLRQGHSVSPDDLATAVKNAGFTLKKIEQKDATY